MIDLKKFAEVLFDSSLDEEVKNFILENFDNFSKNQKEEIFEILKKDVKNSENILNLSKIKFENEEKKFKKESKKLELEVLKSKLKNK